MSTARNLALKAAARGVGAATGVKVLAVALLGMVLGLMFIAPFAGGGGTTSGGGNSCVPLNGPQLPGTTGPGSMDQQENAKIINTVREEMGLPGQATLVALMTALQESKLRNINYGDRDSIGLFQQRPSMGWGSIEQIMDPRYSSRKFFEGLKEVQGWPSLRYTVAAQTVQRSGFADAYAQWEDTARGIAATLRIDLTAPGDPYGNGSSSTGDGGGGANCVSGPQKPGDTTPQECTEKDPTTSGCLTPRMLNLYTKVRPLHGSGWSCFSPRPGTKSDHSTGMACDATFGNLIGQHPTPDQLAAGWAMCEYLQHHATEYGLNYLIWQGQIWTVARSAEGWRPYTGGGMHNPASVTGGHFDHVHISVY